MLRTSEKRERGDSAGGRGVGLLSGLFCPVGAQKSQDHLLGDLAGPEPADSAIEDRGRKEGVRYAKPAGFGIKNLADQLHALRRKRLRIPKPDDEQLARTQN